ncbi:unnamed protein product, partial [Polarella glacialis]
MQAPQPAVAVRTASCLYSEPQQQRQQQRQKQQQQQQQQQHQPQQQQQQRQQQQQCRGSCRVGMLRRAEGAANHRPLVVRLQPQSGSRPAQMCLAASGLVCSLLGQLQYRRRRRKWFAVVARSKDDEKEGFGNVSEWFEKKKAEGTGGAGGAVIGGMLGGPLGAFLGAQVGSRMGPALQGVLNSMDDDEAPAEQPAEEVERGSGSDDAKEKKNDKNNNSNSKNNNNKTTIATAAPAAATTTTATTPSDELSALKSKAIRTPTETRDPSELQQQPEQQQQQLPSTAKAASPPPPKPSVDLAGEMLSSLRKGVGEKRKLLENEIAELYAQAEKALSAGDEQAARGFLEKRAAARAALQSVCDGQKRRAQAEVQRLQTEVDA